MKNCPVCNFEIEVSSKIDLRFCMNCGSNLWLRSRKIPKEEEIDDNSEEVEKFYYYNEYLEKTQGQEDVIQSQIEQINAIQDDIKSIEWTKRGAKYDLEMDKRRFDDINSIFSLNNIKLRIKGEYGQEKERLESRYQEELESYEAVINQEENLKEQLKIMKQDLKELQEINQKRKKYQNWQTQILEKLTKNVEIPGEESLIAQIEELEKIHEPLASRYNAHRMAKDLLKDSLKYLRNANENTQAARAATGFDSGMLSGITKYRATNSAQQNTAIAMSKIAQARKYTNSISSVSSPHIQGGSSKFDAVFDSEILDLSSRFKLERSSSSIKKTADKVKSNIKALENLLENLYKDYRENYEQLLTLKKKLNKLRYEYVKESLSPKQ